MVEADMVPGLLTVTVSTFSTIAPCVHVIEVVARTALARCSLVSIAGMTAVAGYLCMFAMQGKLRFIMIEVLLLPAFNIVAVIALLAQFSTVRIILTVT